MINVTPNHEKAEEAYPTVKAMTCDRISIIAQPFQKSETETGYYIAGIHPNRSELGGFNREQWLAEYEQLNP